MKRIKYLYNIPINHGDEENPTWEDCLYQKDLPYSETAEEIARAEAYNGEYEIYDDGLPEPEPTPSGGDSAVWDELDAAYQKGVDSV